MSGQGAFGDRGCGCSSTVVKLAAWVVLFVALMVASCSMAPRQQPPNTTNPCGEMQDRDVACEGDG